MLQDVTLSYLESTGIETTQHFAEWDKKLSHRTRKCRRGRDVSWDRKFETGELQLRPTIIRLGLRDLVDPAGLMIYEHRLPKSRLTELLARNGMNHGVTEVASKQFVERLRTMDTDFVLKEVDRNALDLAAFILVHGKLRNALSDWDFIASMHEWLPEEHSVRCE